MRKSLPYDNAFLTKARMTNASCYTLHLHSKVLDMTFSLLLTTLHIPMNDRYLSLSILTGNDVIHHLTNQQQMSLYVYFKFNNGDTFYKIYDEFSVGDESTKYELSIGGPAEGNLGRY